MQSVIFGNANSTVCRAVVDVGLHGRTSSKHDVSVANLQWSLYQQVPEIASSSIACYMVAKGGYDAVFMLYSCQDGVVLAVFTC